ncbi:MAG: hypothetical protein ACYDB2_07065 [Acidimicrobiales bacterium]
MSSGPKRRRRRVEEVTRRHRKVAIKRKNAAHQLSRQFVNDDDLIVLQDLATTNMVCAPRAKRNPHAPGAFRANGATAKAVRSRSIHNAGGTHASLLSAKAEIAGRIVVTESSRSTSQTCGECGRVDAGYRVSPAALRYLSRAHDIHGEVNVARTVLRAGRTRQASPAQVETGPIPD